MNMADFEKRRIRDAFLVNGSHTACLMLEHDEAAQGIVKFMVVGPECEFCTDGLVMATELQFLDNEIVGQVLFDSWLDYYQSEGYKVCNVYPRSAS